MRHRIHDADIYPDLVGGGDIVIKADGFKSINGFHGISQIRFSCDDELRENYRADAQRDMGRPWDDYFVLASGQWESDRIVAIIEEMGGAADGAILDQVMAFYAGATGHYGIRQVLKNIQSSKAGLIKSQHDAGVRLIEAKRIAGHGHWDRVCRDVIGIAPRTASKYMKFAEAYKGEDIVLGKFEFETMTAAMRALTKPDKKRQARQRRDAIVNAETARLFQAAEHLKGAGKKTPAEIEAALFDSLKALWAEHGIDFKSAPEADLNGGGADGEEAGQVEKSKALDPPKADVEESPPESDSDGDGHINQSGGEDDDPISPESEKSVAEAEKEKCNRQAAEWAKAEGNDKPKAESKPKRVRRTGEDGLGPDNTLPESPGGPDGEAESEAEKEKSASGADSGQAEDKPRISMQARVAELEREVATLKQSRAAISKDRETWKRHVDKWKSRAHKAEARVEELAARVAELEHAAESKGGDLGQMAKSLGISDNRAEELQAAIDAENAREAA